MALDQTTEEIRRRADLVEVVGQYVALRPAGGDRFKACCPFHDEKTPSFNVSRDKGFYKCFGCIEANELIWTDRGLKPIGDILPGERVLDRGGDWREIFAVDSRQAPVISLNTASFRHDALFLTANHTCLWLKKAEALRAFPFLYTCHQRGTRFKGAYKSRFCSKNASLSQGEAREVKPGDFWLFPVTKTRNIQPLSTPNLIREWTSGKKTARIGELPVSREAARLYGFYLAEGSTNPRSICFTFALKEAQSLALETQNLLCQLFDLPSTLHLRPERNTASITCCKTDLARQLEHFFGKGAAHKRIPGQALQWPTEIQNALIEGYLEGDGNRLGLAKTVSRELAYGLFALGIQARKNVSLSRSESWVGSDGVSHREYWNFSQRAREGLAGFFEEINGETYYVSQVGSIEAVEGERTVIDLSVEGTSSFVAKNGMVHNCGVSGDVFKFLMGMENITFSEARKMLGSRYGVEVRERRELSEEQKQVVSEKERLGRVTAAATHFFREQFSGNGGLISRDYARKRGLSRETVEKFGIGYAPDAWDTLRNHLTRKYGFTDDDLIAVGLVVEKKGAEDGLGGLFAENANANAGRRVYDRYRHRLMFPIWDEGGRVIAFGGRALDGGRTGNPDAKYINSPETPLFHKSNVLFAWHIVRPEVSKLNGVIITEGYMDAIAMHEGGFPNTVATLGTALTAQHVVLLRRMSPANVWLCFDGDSAGMRAALRAGPLFADNDLNVRVVRLPSQHDPDTFIREQGTTGMQLALDQAIPLARYRLETTVSARDLSDPHQRSESMREAAEIVNDITDPIEKEAYVNFLVDTLLALESLPTRAERERRRERLESLVKSELIADGKRMGAVERKREMRSIPGGQSNAQANRNENPFYQKKREERQKEADDIHEATQSLGGTGIPSGVVKAEKALLGVLIGHPAWREHVLNGLPLERWTSELHAEIYLAARNWPKDEPISPVEFTDLLSEAAQSIVAEVMLAPDASALPDIKIIDDWIRRVERHWAFQAESEMLEMIRGKVDRGEVVTVEEKALLVVALNATKRKITSSDSADTDA